MTIAWVVVAVVGLLVVLTTRSVLLGRRSNRASTAALADATARVTALMAQVAESNERVESELRELERRLGPTSIQSDVDAGHDDAVEALWRLRLRSQATDADVRSEVFATLIQVHRSFDWRSRLLAPESGLFPAHRGFDEGRTAAPDTSAEEAILDAWRVDEWRDELRLLRLRDPYLRDPEKPRTGVAMRFA